MLNTKNLYVASFWSVPYAAGAGRRGSGGRHGGELRRKEKAEKAKGIEFLQAASVIFSACCGLVCAFFFQNSGGALSYCW